MELEAYDITFSGLKEGKHRFPFEIDNGFFEKFGLTEYNSAHLEADVILVKGSNLMDVHLKAVGTVNVVCDLSAVAYDQPVAAGMDIVVKFGDQPSDDEDILIIPHGEHKFNIAQQLYEMIVLAVPPKRVHPGIKDGTLESPALDKLKELDPERPSRKDDDDIDPRWSELKKLKTDE